MTGFIIVPARDAAYPPAASAVRPDAAGGGGERVDETPLRASRPIQAVSGIAAFR
jgi:hypothetical protein